MAVKHVINLTMVFMLHMAEGHRTLKTCGTAYRLSPRRNSFQAETTEKEKVMCRA